MSLLVGIKRLAALLVSGAAFRAYRLKHKKLRVVKPYSKGARFEIDVIKTRFGRDEADLVYAVAARGGRLSLVPDARREKRKYANVA